MRNDPESKAPSPRLRTRCAIPRALRGAAVAVSFAGLAACGPAGDPEAGAEAFARGLAKAQQNQLAAALPDFARAVELDPSNAEMHSAYGAVLERVDRLDEAQEQYALAARLSPSDPDPRLHLARVARLRDLDERIADAQRVLAAGPETAAAHVNAGNLFLERRRVSSALLHFHEALRLEPNDAAAHTGMGVALVAEHREPRALHHLTRALAADPNDARALDELIWVLATSRDEAIRDVEGALRRAEAAPPPVSSRRLDAIAAAHAFAGRFDEAMRAARGAIEAAVAAQDHVTATQIRGRLALYERGKRFFAPPPDMG